MSAAREYKDIVDELTQAADALRSRDGMRVEQLKELLLEADDERARVEERALLTQMVVELHWEAVVDVLWQEPWMTLRLPPEPDPAADPARLEVLESAVERAAAEVLDARRRVLGFGLR